MNNSQYADLHLHTDRSDGYDTPGGLVSKAARLGFSCISITDHDTCSGYEEAAETALRLGVELIPGIEVSSFSGGRSIHILGYMVDLDSDALKKLVSRAKVGRLERMERIISKLNKLGYKADLDGVLQYTGSGTLGRAILARYLVFLGYFPSVDDVFASILGDGKAACEPVLTFSPDEAIELIAKAGGVSSLAHPGCYGIENDLAELLAELIEAGLDGIEVYSPHNGPTAERQYLDLARRKNLLITGGSDSHGMAEYGRDIGVFKLPYHLVESLKEKAPNTVTIGG